MSIAIVGNGPASLAAAWAAVGLGHYVEIFGPGVKSTLRGPVLLQRPIPGVTVTHPDGYIKQRVIGGSILDYRDKLYGDVNININGDILEDGYHAWRMDDTYDRLWDEFCERITHVEVDARLLSRLVKAHRLVVNTAPADTFCLAEHHSFRSKEVALTWETQVPGQEDNSIIFNAEPNTPWVRSSSVFGNVVTEWPPDQAPPGAHSIWKPIATDCDCWPRVLRTGRFGAWKNETWVDTAYYDTRKALL